MDKTKRKRYSAEFKGKAARSDALEKYGTPEIFNTEQGTQFTGLCFTQTLKDAGVRISMDGQQGLDGQHDGRATVADSEI